MCAALLGIDSRRATCHSQVDPESGNKESTEGADKLDEQQDFSGGNNDGFGEESAPETKTVGERGTNASREEFRDAKSLRRSKRSKPCDTGEKKIADKDSNGTDGPGTDDQPGAKRQCREQPLDTRSRGKTMSHLQ